MDPEALPLKKKKMKVSKSKKGRVSKLKNQLKKSRDKQKSKHGKHKYVIAKKMKNKNKKRNSLLRKVTSKKQILDLEKTYRSVLLGQHYYDFVTNSVDPEHIKDTPKLFNFIYLLKLMIICIPILTFQSSARVQISLMIFVEALFILVFIGYVLRKHIMKSKFMFWMTVAEEFCIMNYLVYCLIASYGDGKTAPTGSQAIYEIVVLLLLFLIMVVQILQVVIVMIKSLGTFLKARSAKKKVKKLVQQRRLEERLAEDGLFAKKNSIQK
jgi:hypothetical protein